MKHKKEMPLKNLWLVFIYRKIKVKQLLYSGLTRAPISPFGPGSPGMPGDPWTEQEKGIPLLIMLLCIFERFQTFHISSYSWSKYVDFNAQKAGDCTAVSPLQKFYWHTGGPCGPTAPRDPIRPMWPWKRILKIKLDLLLWFLIGGKTTRKNITHTAA